MTKNIIAVLFVALSLSMGAQLVWLSDLRRAENRIAELQGLVDMSHAFLGLCNTPGMRNDEITISKLWKPGTKFVTNDQLSSVFGSPNVVTGSLRFDRGPGNIKVTGECFH